MKFIKSHKTLFIVLAVIVILLITIIVLFLKLSPDSRKNAYGNRLVDIEKYPIDQERMQAMSIEFATNLEGVQSVNYTVNGRRINITMKLGAAVPKDIAIQYANKTLEYFTDEVKSYYDIQIFVSTDEESEIYPMIGSKHKTKDTYVWNTGVVN